MEIKNVQKRKRKSVSISIRTTEEKSKFMKENNISPNAVFNKTIDELIKKKK